MGENFEALRLQYERLLAFRPRDLEERAPLLQPVTKVLVQVQWADGASSRIEGHKVFLGSHTQFPDFWSDLDLTAVAVPPLPRPAQLHLVLRPGSYDGVIRLVPKELRDE